MTREQLDAIRARMETGFLPSWPDLRALLAEVERLTAELKDAEEDTKLAETQLAEIVELVGEGGDGSAFGSVESMLATFKEREERMTAEVERMTADPLPAAAWVREVERAAFQRGVAAMREAAAGVKHYCDSCSRTALQRKIRALPDPEDR